MRPEELLQIMGQAAKLKQATRHCWIEADRKESVADHSWRMALMAMLVSHEEEFAMLDMNRVIRMCLIHDLGESFTGDIPTFVKTGQDTKTEDDIYLEWVESFPEEIRVEWMELLGEMIALETPEAKLYKALDKLEAVLTHDETSIDTWLPLEYELQFTYGADNVKYSRFLSELKAAIDQMTREKIAKEGDRAQ